MPARSFRARRLLGALLSGALTLQVGAPALANAAEGRADPELRGKASALYENGVRAFEARRYREAVDQFLAADRLLPSAPLSYNIALAYENLLDVAGALRFYRDYLRRSPTANNGAKVRERVRELELTLAQRGLQQVTVQTQPPGATVVIDGEPVGVAPWTGELAPGEHSLALTLKGRKDVERTFLLPAGHAIDVAQKLEVAPAPAISEGPGPRAPSAASTSPPAPGVATSPHFGVWPWVTLGASGAAFVAAGTFELLRRDSEDEAKNATTQLGFQDRRDTMSSRQTTARIFAGLGGALLVTGGTLLVLRAWSDDDDARSGSVSCAPTGCLGSFRATF